MGAAMDPDKKLARYRRIRDQLASLIAKTTDPIARRATAAALIHHKTPGVSWTGFYMLRSGTLTVDVYQGPLACLVLAPHQGVCWAGIDRRQTVVVPDVHSFPGHVACDSRSRSEIVVPLLGEDGIPKGVLDVDSHLPAHFDDADQRGLEEVVAALARRRLRIYESGVSYHGRSYSEGKKIGVRDGFRAIYCILKYNLPYTTPVLHCAVFLMLAAVPLGVAAGVWSLIAGVAQSTAVQWVEGLLAVLALLVPTLSVSFHRERDARRTVRYALIAALTVATAWAHGFLVDLCAPQGGWVMARFCAGVGSAVLFFAGCRSVVFQVRRLPDWLPSQGAASKSRGGGKSASARTP